MARAASAAASFPSSGFFHGSSSGPQPFLALGKVGAQSHKFHLVLRKKLVLRFQICALLGEQPLRGLVLQTRS